MSKEQSNSKTKKSPRKISGSAKKKTTTKAKTTTKTVASKKSTETKVAKGQKVTPKVEKVVEEKKVTKKPSKSDNTIKESYFKSVKRELKNVKWPSVKEVLKYTVSTLALIIIVVVFFSLLNLGMSFIKGLFN